MSQEKQCNNKEVNYNSNEELDCVDEECANCHKHMTNVKYIWVGIKDDLYYCQSCKNTYNINAVKCKDIN